MKLKMNENSIFAVLLRSPWWMSAGIAAALFAATRLVLPAEYGPYAFFAALPFFVIAGYLGWQQLRAPSEARITQAMEALRAMAWTEFSAAVEEAFRREGYTVARIAAAGADLELTKAGRVTLVACKRWKVARTGIEPLRELDSARQCPRSARVHLHRHRRVHRHCAFVRDGKKHQAAVRRGTRQDCVD